MKNRLQVTGYRLQKIRSRRVWLPAVTCHLSPGFTLVETLLAVSLMCVAITAPMLLTVRALSSAYYSRDEITAFYLAQEGLEAVHAIRDAQVLTIALTPGPAAAGIDLFGALSGKADGRPFTIDITNQAVQDCSQSACQDRPLRTNGTLYAYDSSWDPTNFRRTMRVCYIQAGGTCGANPETNEIRVTATVSWRTSSFAERSFTISEDLYRWVVDGSGV